MKGKSSNTNILHGEKKKKKVVQLKPVRKFQQYSTLTGLFYMGTLSVQDLTLCFSVLKVLCVFELLSVLLSSYSSYLCLISI